MASRFKEIGHRLKQYMQHRGLTINKLAKSTKLSGKKLHRIIDGKHSSLKNLLLILDLLTDLNQVWLMTGSGDMQNHGKPEKKTESKQTVQLPKSHNQLQAKILAQLEKLTATQEKIVKQNKKLLVLLQDAKPNPSEKDAKKQRSKT